MKRAIGVILVLVAVGAVIGVGPHFGMGMHHAAACGWGAGNGQGYAPQRLASGSGYTAKPALTEQQARQIVDNHIKSLNSELNVGQFTDAGEFYEAEIVSPDHEVVQVLGVDKHSGRLILIN